MLKSALIICSKCDNEKHSNEFHCRGLRSHPALCKNCYKKIALEYQRAWNKMPGAKERRKKYNQNPKCKEARKIWNQSEKGVEYNKEYSKRPEIIEYHKLYSKRPERKDKDRLYRQRPEVKDRLKRSISRKEYSKKYIRKPEVKERLNEYRRQNARDVADSYAKDLILKKTNGVLSAKDIPLELIETQRQSIILKRTIKQKKEENEQHATTDV